MIKILATILFCSTTLLSNAQDYDLNNQWYSIGPEELPSPNSNSSAKGIGPIEFIRTTPLEKGLLLAGSLSGGLFYSNDGGEYWLNSGSDNWVYSTSTWADFYPENQNVWFACSHEKASKAGKGRLDAFGGVHRTMDKGISWKQIGNFKSFGGLKSVVIYKTVFHPQNSKKMYVITNHGLYYTNNCLDDEVKWVKDNVMTEDVYDLVFIGDKMVLSAKQNKTWVLKFDEINSNAFSALTTSNINKYTFTKDSVNLYLLVDYKSGSDKIYHYDYVNDKLTELSKSQRVTFGSGRVFTVNPYDVNEIFVGVSIRLRKWNIKENKFENLGSDYHVDVEFVTFDPFNDSIIYMANHGGVYISYNKGKSWESKSKGLGVAEVLGMAVAKSDPNQVVIGTYHDGSSIYADWDKNGSYYWKNVNGGDALIPLINPKNNAEVYTSNQYTGGGVYYSNDTSKTVSNIHSKNRLKTSGWQMSAALHPTETNVLFFNSMHSQGDSKGSSDAFRTANASERMNAEQISDFGLTHQIKDYTIYGLFTSNDHPNILLAYLFHSYKDDKGKSKTKFRLFRTLNSLDSSSAVIASWHELELPRETWVGDIKIDKKNKNKMYVSSAFGGKLNAEYPSETGMVFYAKYRNKNNKLKRNSDISYPIHTGTGGKYNMVYSDSTDKLMFIGTGNGVFMREASLFGWKNWVEVGHGLPHCMVYGLDYNEDDQILTVGLKGRGVWKVSIESKE